MTKNDQVVIATIVTSAIQTTVPGMIKDIVTDIIEQNNHMLKLDLRDEIHAAKQALRSELKADMQQLRADMHTMRTEIVSDIAEILDVAVLTPIAELRYDVALLKARVGV